MYKHVLLRRMQSAEAKAAARISTYKLQKRQAARTVVRAVLYCGIIPASSLYAAYLATSSTIFHQSVCAMLYISFELCVML